jgi:hypothetical protein
MLIICGFHISEFIHWLKFLPKSTCRLGVHFYAHRGGDTSWLTREHPPSPGQQRGTLPLASPLKLYPFFKSTAMFLSLLRLFLVTHTLSGPQHSAEVLVSASNHKICLTEEAPL